MNPPILPTRLDWPPATGNFILNCGVLDWHISVYLESPLPHQQFAKIKDEHWKTRIERVRTLVNNGDSSAEEKAAFATFFAHLDPVRELRNRIAHGHLLLRVAEDGKLPS